MSNWGSIISSLAPDAIELVSSLAETAVKNKKTVSNQKTQNKKKSTKNNKKATKKIEPEVSKQKDRADKVCDDIKTKNSIDNKIKPISISLNIKSEELAKYIVYSEILGQPACKKNRIY